jgi:hypothetical protein
VRTARWPVAALALAACLTACGGGGGGAAEPAPAPEPIASPPPAPPATPPATPPIPPVLPPIATGWEDPLIVSNPGEASNGGARLEIDALGQALTVWKQSTNPGEVLWSSRFTPVVGWSTPTALYRGPGNLAHYELAMEQTSGKAVAVWTLVDGSGSYTVSARSFNASTAAWSAPTVVSSETRTMSQPSVAIDAGGNAAVVWAQLDARFRYNVWAARYSGSASNWGSATTVGTTTVTGSTDLNPKVAMTTNSEAVAVWRRSGNSERGFWSSRASLGGLWSAGARIVDIPNFGSSTAPGAFDISSKPEIAADYSGGAMLAWSQLTVGPIQSHMRSLRYSGGAWATDQQAMNSPIAYNTLPFVRLKFNPQGQAVAAWGIDNDNKVWANRSRADGTWETAQALNPTVTSTITSQPAVGIDNTGAMLVVWKQSSASIMGNRFEPASGWQGAQRLENYDPITSITADPIVAMNARGYASLVFTAVLNVNTFGGSQILGRFYNSGR